MNRTTSLAAALIVGTSSVVFGQQFQSTPSFPDEGTSGRLVAWSWMQKPQPTPQPLPPRDTPIPQPDQQTTRPVPDPAQQEAPAQSFMGKILRDGSNFVLKANNAIY